MRLASGIPGLFLILALAAAPAAAAPGTSSNTFGPSLSPKAEEARPPLGDKRPWLIAGTSGETADDWVESVIKDWELESGPSEDESEGEDESMTDYLKREEEARLREEEARFEAWRDKLKAGTRAGHHVDVPDDIKNTFTDLWLDGWREEILAAAEDGHHLDVPEEVKDKLKREWLQAWFSEIDAAITKGKKLDLTYEVRSAYEERFWRNFESDINDFSERHPKEAIYARSQVLKVNSRELAWLYGEGLARSINKEYPGDSRQEYLETLKHWSSPHLSRGISGYTPTEEEEKLEELADTHYELIYKVFKLVRKSQKNKLSAKEKETLSSLRSQQKKSALDLVRRTNEQMRKGGGR